MMTREVGDYIHEWATGPNRSEWMTSRQIARDLGLRPDAGDSILSPFVLESMLECAPRAKAADETEYRPSLFAARRVSMDIVISRHTTPKVETREAGIRMAVEFYLARSQSIKREACLFPWFVDNYIADRILSCDTMAEAMDGVSKKDIRKALYALSIEPRSTVLRMHVKPNKAVEYTTEELLAEYDKHWNEAPLNT